VRVGPLCHSSALAVTLNMKYDAGSRRLHRLARLQSLSSITAASRTTGASIGSVNETAVAQPDLTRKPITLPAISL
jgi:hypothetical protein